MKYLIQRTTQFKKDYKLASKRGYNQDLLKKVISILACGDSLPTNYKDHSLVGTYAGYRECHIQPDWLLIYKITETKLLLTLSRTGSHADLF